jgi:hypothetical protein
MKHNHKHQHGKEKVILGFLFIALLIISLV